MVDPSVHRYYQNLSGSDESSGGYDLRPARKNSSSSVSEGDGATSTQGKVRKSRSRTRRPWVNSAVEIKGSHKKDVPKNSKTIDEHTSEQSSSASSRSASRASSSSKSSSSEAEAMKSSPKAPSNRKSCSETQSATYSVDQSMQSSSKAIPKKKPNPDPCLYNESSSSKNESKQSPPKAVFEGKSLSDTTTDTSSSEDDAMQSSPKPISKGKSTPETNTGSSSSEDESGKSNSDTNSGSSGSEDEPMQSSPKPTSKGKSTPNTNTGTSGSEDESENKLTEEFPKPSSTGESIPVTSIGMSNSKDQAMQSPPKPTSKGKSISVTKTENSSSEDVPMQSSPKPTSKGKSTPETNTESSSSEDESEKSNSDTNSGSSGSEDEPMQSWPKPTSKGKSTPDTNTGTSSSDDELIQELPKPTSKGNSIPDTTTGISNSKDQGMQSPPKPTSKGKSISVTKTGNSNSEDEPMKSSPKPTSKGKSTPETNTGSSGSEDNLPKSTLKGKSSQENELIGLEEVSSTPISEDENEGVLSKLSGIQIDIDGEKSLHKKNPESFELQQRKVLGDKLTVKFKVTLPETGVGLIGGPLQFLRVPQFIPIESGAFDAETFKDSMTPDDLKDEQARGDFLNRLKTTVRWRENKDKTKESNARIVRWSDGSETFHVGSEVFDVMHHKVIDDKNHLYVRLENCFQAQGSITDKMTLRPKLDSTFGQSHVQGLRNRAMNKPQTGVVKVLSDLVANPSTDRERRAKEEIANLRKEEREKRREIQMSMRKPRVKPMRHCTADDSDPEQPGGEQEDLEDETVQSVCSSSIGSSNTQGIRTNRNVAVNLGRFESTDEEDEEEGCDSDVNDIINDDDIDADDEEMSDEPKTSNSKSQKAPPSRHSSKSDSDEGPKTRIVKRKTKRVVYSESD